MPEPHDIIMGAEEQRNYTLCSRVFLTHNPYQKDNDERFITNTRKKGARAFAKAMQ